MEKIYNVSNTIENGSRMDRVKSRIDSIQPAYTLLALLMVVLFGVNENAWAEACALYTSNGGSVNAKSGAIYTTDVFTNTDGIDSIRFTYSTPTTLGQKLLLKYSTNGGSGYTNIDTYAKKSNRTLCVTLSGTQKNANCFQFAIDGSTLSNYSYSVSNITVYRSPKLSLNTSSFEFSQTAVDASIDQTFTVSTYSITATPDVEITGANASYFSWALSDPMSDCPKTRTLTITYTPGAETVGEAKHEATVTVSAAGKSATLTVYGTASDIATSEFEWHGEDTYDVDADSLDLSTLWTSTGGGAITYSITSFTPTSGEQDGSTAPKKVGNKISLGKAGTLVLGLSQAEGNGYTGGTDSKTITIARRNPVFAWKTQANYYYNTTIDEFLTKTSGASYTVTSNNEEVASIDEGDLTIYNKPGTVKIKYVHPQTYKWNEKKDSVTFTPGWKNDTVSFSLTDGNHTNYESANTFSSNYAYWNNDKDGYFLGATSMSEVSTKRENYAIIHFTGIPDTLYFDQKLNKYVVLPKDRVCYVMVSANGSTWNDTVWRQEAEIEYMNNQKVCLPSSTRYIKFYYNGTISSEYKNIRVSRRKYFRTDKSSIDFRTNLKDSSPAPLTFKFHHASAGYITSVTSNNAHFSVTPTSVVTGGEICDSTEITVTYHPTDVATHNGKITISDNLGNTVEVNVTGKTVEKFTPTITWSGETSFLVGSTIPNGFVAVDDNGDPISEAWTLSSGDDDVINIDGEGVMSAVCGGLSTTITGTIGGGKTNYYERSFGKSLSVTRNGDSFTWSGINEEDGKIHVWADSDIPSSIARANADVTVTYNSTGSAVSVTNGTTLRAVERGEIVLTAISTGDCIYEPKNESKYVVVDPCPQRIVWEQTFNHYKGDEENNISEEVTLTAYAVDSSGVRTEQPITYSFESAISFASVNNETKKLTISGLGRTKIIATVAGSTKYASTSVSKVLYARAYDAVCENDTLYYQGDDSENVTGNDGGPYYKFALGISSNTKSREIKWAEGGRPAYVTFYRKSEDSNQGDMKIEQWLPSINNWSLVKNEGLAPSGTWTYDSLHLDSTATKLRVRIESGKKNHYFRSLTVVRARYIEVREGSTPITSLTYTAEVNVTQAKTLRVMHSNINTQINLTLSDGAPFTLSTTEIEGSCDGSSYSDITLTYNPVATETSSSYTLTLTDGTVTKVINLTATATSGAEEVMADKSWSELGIEGGLSTSVVIKTEKTLTIDQEVTLYSIEIEEDATLLIAPTGGLTLGAGGVIGGTLTNLVLKAATDEEENTGLTGYLRISPDYTGEMPEATIELFSAATHSSAAEAGSKTKWQCVGAPISDEGVEIKSVYPAGTWFYSYDEGTNTWLNVRAKGTFEPFKGYKTSQKLAATGKLYSHKGHLVSGRTEHTIELDSAADGYNLLANSFAAPIAISRFESGDFVDAQQTIYFLNAGTTKQSQDNVGGNDAPGKWVSVPINTAAELAKAGLPCVISPMQGFWVRAKSDDAKLKLNYTRLVWEANYNDANLANKPLRAPRRAAGDEDEEVVISGRLKISLSTEGGNDNLYLLESNVYDAAYEDGFDAYKLSSGGAEIFAIASNEEQLYVDATKSLIGTKIGVRTGEDAEYTMHFSHLNGRADLALYDNETYITTNIEEGTEYTFYAVPDSEITGRFSIIERDNSSKVTTGAESASDSSMKGEAVKFIKDGHLFVLKGGVLYDATGLRVK